jgi:hypothetical protein
MNTSVVQVKRTAVIFYTLVDGKRYYFLQVKETGEFLQSNKPFVLTTSRKQAMKIQSTDWGYVAHKARTAFEFTDVVRGETFVDPKEMD